MVWSQHVGIFNHSFHFYRSRRDKKWLRYKWLILLPLLPQKVGITPHILFHRLVKILTTRIHQKAPSGISPSNFDPIIEGMRRVCNEPGGTKPEEQLSKALRYVVKPGQRNHTKTTLFSFVFSSHGKTENSHWCIYWKCRFWWCVWAARAAKGLMIEKYINCTVKDKAKETMILNANPIECQTKPMKKK